jgi:hypothetical protein
MPRPHRPHEEEEVITEQDIANIRYPLVNGRVSCTECRKRPLVVARLCHDCYDQRMREAEWRKNLSVVRRGKGSPKLVCPWCQEQSVPDLEPCCPKMRAALYEVEREGWNQFRATENDLGVEPL